MAEKLNCTIVSGAPNDSAAFIKDNIDLNSFIIAADSGYNQLVSAGITPNLIIADFDSGCKPEFECEIITLNTEKADTDTFSCIKYAVENGYKSITVFNAIGNRFDHTYSNLLCLDYCKKHGVSCIIADKHNKIQLIEKELTFEKCGYNYFSLFAFLEDCRGVKIKGAYYTAGWYGKDRIDILLGDQNAQSNYITDEECTVSLESGTLLLVQSSD